MYWAPRIVQGQILEQSWCASTYDSQNDPAGLMTCFTYLDLSMDRRRLETPERQPCKAIRGGNRGLEQSQAAVLYRSGHNESTVKVSCSKAEWKGAGWVAVSIDGVQAAEFTRQQVDKGS